MRLHVVFSLPVNNGRISKNIALLTMRKRFVLCIDNKGYEASLIPRKIYEVIPDEQAEQDGFVRVIDESGEDYLYYKNHFVFVELPEEVVRVLVIT